MKRRVLQVTCVVLLIATVSILALLVVETSANGAQPASSSQRFVLHKASGTAMVGTWVMLDSHTGDSYMVATIPGSDFAKLVGPLKITDAIPLKPTGTEKK